ncbi:MAG TPA: VWA domain-containing protein [Vicinamibacterales bacterium]|nr:VWA domain-containing protein [Vicinamibacterales bacterium]
MPFVALLAWSGAASDAASQQPAFAARVESVRVDVLVIDNGRPILGLAPADFEIVDNGVPQQVDLVSFENIPLNVVLALDMSDSVAGERLEQLQDAGRAMLGGLRKGDQAAVVTFSNAVTRAAPLTEDISIVRDALDEAWGTGMTSLADGVYAAMMIGEADAGRALVMVFSDGLDTSSWLTDDRVLDSAKRGDAVVYSVGVGDRGNSSFLKELTSLTGGTAYKVDSTRDLRATFLRILDEFRHRYLVSYTPRGVSRDGWHRLDVRVKNRRATIKARPGYLAGS